MNVRRGLTKQAGSWDSGRRGRWQTTTGTTTNRKEAGKNNNGLSMTRRKVAAREGDRQMREESKSKLDPERKCNGRPKQIRV